jgi:site-specific DNA-methyltransferase (adenine-specific)
MIYKEFKGRSNIKIYNGDCMEYMKEMKENQFDLAIVDPPYGIGNFTKSDRKHLYNVQDISWNMSIPDKIYFEELKRISNKRIIWGANYYNCFENEHGAIIWDKEQPWTDSMSRCEIASKSFQKKVDYVKIRHYGNVGENNFHPCGKPVQLYKWLLQNYAKEGDTILDTHLGSGSIAIACWDLGFDLTAFEIDKEYFDKACERIDWHTRQKQLF